MIIGLSIAGALRLEDIEGSTMHLFRQIPDAANPHGDSRALDRLYPPPIPEGEATEFVDDWHEFVQPDLQHLFESSNGTVRRDLDAAAREDDAWTLEIPLDHLAAWMSSLNQARLVLAERHRFGEEDLEAEPPIIPVNSREVALFQMHLYAILLESIIELREWRQAEE